MGFEMNWGFKSVSFRVCAQVRVPQSELPCKKGYQAGPLGTSMSAQGTPHPRAGRCRPSPTDATSRASPETPLPAPIQSLVNYIQPRLAWMDYPTHREQGHAIGTGLMEATVKQLVGQRLKGCGMHWSRDGATAITALRSTDLNGHWHQTWKTLALSA